MQRYHLQMVILSRGGSGSLLVTPAKSSDHPGIITHIEDTIGAGDSFTAAATIGYLQGLPLDEINEQANRIAAYVCTQQGAMPHVPDLLSS
jgi:fructokinase